MEAIILEANLQDLVPPVVVENPFKDKSKKRSFLSGEWRSSAKAGDKCQQQSAAGKVQLILRKTTESASSALNAAPSLSSTSSSYYLRFLNVTIRNEKDLPAFVVLCRTSARELANEKQLKQLEGNAETVLLDNGPEGQWKGCHFPATFDQELVVFDPLGFASVMICKPSVAKPPSILPLVFAYGVFQSYSPPAKTPEQIALEMETLSNKLLHTVMEIEQDELQNHDQLSLDELQRNAKQLFKMFDQDKSNSIDFEGVLTYSPAPEYQQMLAYRKLNILESKAKRFFQLVDDQKKGYIDEREFVTAMYITNYLRVHAATKHSKSGKVAASAAAPLLSPVDVFHQMDADRDELLNVFEYEKALELLGVRAEKDSLRVHFPKNSPTINMDQFKAAWLHLVDVRSELKKRNILISTSSTASTVDGTQTTPAVVPQPLPADKGTNTSRSTVFSGFPLLRAKRNKEVDQLRRLLLESINKEEQEELDIALKAKEEVIQLEKQRRDALQEEKRRLYNQQRHTATSMRTNEALRERQEKITRKKERVIKERQAKEERRLLHQIAIDAEKRKAHQMQAIQEHMASKMNKIVTQKAKCGDDVINLCGRRLKELPTSLFRGRDALNTLSSLLILDLSKNRLQNLPGAMFAHLFTLQALNLSDNELEALPVEIGEIRDLQVLDLHSNQLRAVPDQIKHLHYLKVLDLAYNQLQTFGGECCDGLFALEELNLSSNRLESLSESVGSLSALQTLLLRGNPTLKVLPGALQRLGGLITWDFSACAQKRIGKDVFGPSLSNLRALTLAHNMLSSLPAGIGKVKWLQALDVKNNLLISLPPQLCELTELVVLNAKSNKLACLLQEIGYLLALESLFLSSNKLSELPPTIGLLVNLRRLDLQSNRLQNVPMEMGALVQLEELNLSWNEITSLPEEIGCLASLRTVNLSHNRISHLPDAIVLWQSLETLSCNHNWLTTPLTPSLRELQTLRYIDLSQNQLTQLEPCIYELENLEVLNLASNHITFLSKEMVAATCINLRKLDLYNNRLHALPVEMAELLPRLDVFSIERNPMKYLPEKWSGHWRLEDQYKTAFAKGYTQTEVKEWVHDQSICYPVIVSVWKQLISSIQAGSLANDGSDSIIAGEPDVQQTMAQLGGSDAFVENVQLVMESDNSWEPRFQRIVRHYFYEFKYLGHAVVYDDMTFDERAENAAVESELHETQQRRATDAIDENNVFRAHIESSYRVDLDQVMATAIETRKRHEQKLLAELREETHQLNEIVGEKVSASLVAREERFRRQRAQFAIEMKRAAREKQDQRLARKAEMMQQVAARDDGRQEHECESR